MNEKQASLHEEKPSMELKERMLQFGTGILLKGLPDYLIQLANEKRGWGKIVMVKSTSPEKGKEKFPPYYLVEKGIQNGQAVERAIKMEVISREINAQTQWDTLQKLAKSADLEVIISNTTEAGLQYKQEKINETEVPESFPAKLLALLQTRFKADLPGWIIIPCELIPENGKVLFEIIKKLAQFNEMSPAFVQWLEKENHFCSSLVDRIVSGKANQQSHDAWEAKLGHKIPELIETEPYCLWAIECSDEVMSKLNWEGIHPNLILDADISMYKERKLRILNGTHTFMVGLAFLAGHDTVLEAMQDPEIGNFVRELALNEIAPATDIDPEKAQEFARDVLDRFSNPHIRHLLLNITLQYSMKMAMRNLKSIERYESQFGNPPEKMARGFAAYLQFVNPREEMEGQFFGIWRGKKYLIQDNEASLIRTIMQAHPEKNQALDSIFQSASLWGEFRFSEGFKEKVKGYYYLLEEYNRRP